MLWDSTEAYRALYYVLPGAADEGRQRPSGDHRARWQTGDATRAVALQDAHRERALERLRVALGG